MPGEAFDALVAHELKDPEARREYEAEMDQLAEQQEDADAARNIRRSMEEYIDLARDAENYELTAEQRARAADELTELTEEMGLYDDRPANGGEA